MFSAVTTFENKADTVQKEADKAKVTRFRIAGFRIRKEAVASIVHQKDKDKASPEGKPPHQHRPGFLKRAIWSHADVEGAVIGFRRSKVGGVAATHEHGEQEDGRDYPQRPTMGPALERKLDQVLSDWRASIG
jgi:hypothetical protein